MYQKQSYKSIALNIAVLSAIFINFLPINYLNNKIFASNWYVRSHHIWLVLLIAVILTFIENQFIKIQYHGKWLDLLILLIALGLFYYNYHMYFGIWIHDTKVILITLIAIIIIFACLYNFMTHAGEYLSPGGFPNYDTGCGTYEDASGNTYTIYGHPGDYYYYDKSDNRHTINDSNPDAHIYK